MSKISNTHTELFHYTTAAGLSGILESKSLWATHSSFVNDEEEILGFYDRILPKFLHPIFLKIFEEIRTLPVFQKQQLNVSFESYRDEHFAKLMNAFRTTSPLMHDHYIASFSTPNDEWVREHGLLSQWRAYGSDGGYALVFDTTALDDIINVEAIPYQNEIFFWSDVQYHLDENRRTKDKDTNQRIEQLEITADKYFRTGSADDAGELSLPLTILSSIFKHRGFEEEREVRLVLSLLGPLLASHPELQASRQHKVNSRIRMGETVPFVELCVREKNGIRQHLPIKRIIVGPHRDKNNRKRAVQLLLKQHGLDPNIVTVSDIPYRESAQ